MLKIENVTDRELTILRVSGDLAGSDVLQLERSWERARASAAVRVDLCAVKSIDCGGQGLLRRMFAAGAQLSVAPSGPRFSCNPSSLPREATARPVK